MIRLYCDAHHQSGGELCSECHHLQEYALEALDRCPFQEGKTTCAKCPVQCYRPDMREMVRRVMRYAGPRMIHRHPRLALRHLVDGLRQQPDRPSRKAAGE